MADVKPDMASISIKLKSDGKEELVFKVKKSTKMQKVMATYASRTGQTTNALRFVFDDKPVKDEDTPESLGLEEGDQIDVFIPQTGGASTPAWYSGANI